MRIAGKAVPPGEHTRRMVVVVEHGAVRVTQLQPYARLAADGVVERTGRWNRDRGARERALVHGDLGVDRVGQGLGDAGARDREDLDASTSLDQRRNRIGSDQRDSPRAARGDREDSAVVFEQHERARRDLAHQRRIDQSRLRRHKRDRRRLLTAVDESVQRPEAPAKGQEPRHLVVDIALSHRACAHRLDELLAPRPLRARHDKVETADCAGNRRRRRRPVGDHGAGKLPLALEDAAHKRSVGCHGRAVDRVVGRHDEKDAGLRDTSLERGEV